MDLPPLSIFLGENEQHTEGHSCTDKSSLYGFSRIIYFPRGETSTAPRGIVLLTHLPCMDLPPLSLFLGETSTAPRGIVVLKHLPCMDLPPLSIFFGEKPPPHGGSYLY